MLYRQDISGCLLELIGALGLGAGELGAFLERTRPSLDRLRDQHAKRTEPLLAIPAQRDDLKALAPFAAEFRRFEHVVVLGTGGSSLGGQTLYALADPGFGPELGTPRLHFLENIDPASFEALLQHIDRARTGRDLEIGQHGRAADAIHDRAGGAPPCPGAQARRRALPHPDRAQGHSAPAHGRARIRSAHRPRSRDRRPLLRALQRRRAAGAHRRPRRSGAAPRRRCRRLSRRRPRAPLRRRSAPRSASGLPSCTISAPRC